MQLCAMIRRHVIVAGALLAACAAPEPPPAAEVQPAASVSAVPSPPSAPAQEAPTASTGVDTAGLGARIATAYPGYRLTTENEILQRWERMEPGVVGSSEFRREFPVGSGNVWWVWTGDFDGDGRPDRATILTQADDPTQDRAVVFHADGTHARLLDTPGTVLRIVPKGTLAVTCDGEVPLAAEGVEVRSVNGDWVYGWDPSARKYSTGCAEL